MCPIGGYAMMQEGSFQNSKNEIQFPVNFNQTQTQQKDEENKKLDAMETPGLTTNAYKSSKEAQISQSCECQKLREDLKILSELHQVSEQQLKQELLELQEAVQKIKDVVGITKIEDIPLFIAKLIQSDKQSKTENSKLEQQVQDLQSQCSSLNLQLQQFQESSLRAREESKFQQSFLESKSVLQDKEIEGLRVQL